jgi:3-oxoacyl-[acyl-carrier protein] reductase
MLLADKVAIVYGGGGVIGSAVAHAFARAGAQVQVAGRTRARVNGVARDIVADGGRAQAAQVDALDERSVQQHADEVAARAGRIDIAFNAVGVAHVQGVPLLDLTLDDYFHPVHAYTRTHFIAAKAVARHMTRQKSGVILTLATPGGRMSGPGFIGHGVACAGIEALTRLLAGELGDHGVRVVCIRSHAIPETVTKGSHAAQVFGEVAARGGTTVAAMLAGAANGTLLKRLPTLDELANTAVFLASAHAGAMTGAIANLSCGMTLD